MVTISAQVSVYPLGQEKLAPTIDEVLRIFAEHHLDVDPGVMSTLLIGDGETVFAAIKSAFERVAGHGSVVMVVTFSNACPLPESDMEQRKTRGGEKMQ